MNFGQALKALKEGKKVRRSGWSDKREYLYYVPAAAYAAMTDIAKEEWGDGGTVPYTAYIAKKTGERDVTPWNASHPDLLSEDWEIIS